MFKPVHFLNGRFMSPFFPVYTRPWFAGFNIEILNDPQTVYEKIFSPGADAELFALHMKSSKILPEDYWDLYHDGEPLFKNIYCKDISEGIYLMVAHRLTPASILQFIYTADKSSPQAEPYHVEVTYDFLIREPVPGMAG
ncbi:hypothetical protein DCCM_0378 [Desulfocucumis palustris]|uniref:Uncharacterized protein n=1 Tax=Desulfocucumis palustris TaxID=1898651 RepID=A0A2L2X7L6_9FIRM|nr:hypothetical protein [Desulfocucumis palustris]GBF32187.1 hypothetical protein DCCM_0378 [Desulfocucumis palustris]